MMNELTNDQTAPIEQSDFEKSIKGKTVLIIGSGADIDGRRLAKQIDNTNRFDIVARVNKHYGNEIDTGKRTDVIVTRWLQWVKDGINFFTNEEIENAKQVIILNQHVGFSQTENQIVCNELGVEKVSAGIQAVSYFLNRGAKTIYLLGFGMTKEGFMNEKKYCKHSINYKDGMKDTNQFYDWNKEKTWLKQQSKIIFL